VSFLLFCDYCKKYKQKLFSFLIAYTTTCCTYKTPQYGNYLKRDGDKLQVYDGYVKDKGALLQTAWKKYYYGAEEYGDYLEED